MPAGNDQGTGLGTKRARRGRLHRRMQPHARGRRENRQDPRRSLDGILGQLARLGKPHAGVCLTATWHYANVDEGFTYETMTKNPDGDIVEAIDRIVAELKGGQLDPA